MTFLRNILLTAVIALGALSSNAERNPLAKPTYDTDLGDTSSDVETFDSETGEISFRDSNAVAKFDLTTGIYKFQFEDAAGDIRKAEWIPRSNVDAIFSAKVTEHESGVLQYEYRADLLPTSVRHLTRIMVETISDVVDPKGLGALSPPERVARWGLGEWVGQELSKEWGRRLWIWTRYTGDLDRRTARESSYVSISSRGLPTLRLCWVQGDGNDLFSEHEPPSSLSRFHGARSGILKDAAKGVTVAPGFETVELPALMLYFDTSIEQGWLEEGAYRDEVKALLTFALSAHEQRKTAQVLRTLTSIQENVSAVYAQDNSPMLSEAYALLHFNIDYLLANYEKDLAVNGAAE